MITIWQILTHTPWWVFALFLYLLKIGIDGTKPRVISLRKIFILPVIFLIISISSLFSSFPIASMVLSTYITSMLVGIVGGWVLAWNLKLSFDHTHRLVKIPGSFMTLIFILTIFSTKYYLGYSIAKNPEIIQETRFIIFQLIVSGVSAGLFLGRLACYLFRKSQSSHEDLRGRSLN